MGKEIRVICDYHGNMIYFDFIASSWEWHDTCVNIFNSSGEKVGEVYETGGLTILSVCFYKTPTTDGLDKICPYVEGLVITNEQH